MEIKPLKKNTKDIITDIKKELNLETEDIKLNIEFKNEKEKSVEEWIEYLTGCIKNRIPISICGQSLYIIECFIEHSHSCGYKYKFIFENDTEIVINERR